MFCAQGIYTAQNPETENKYTLSQFLQLSQISLHESNLKAQSLIGKEKNKWKTKFTPRNIGTAILQAVKELTRNMRLL